MVFTWHMRRLSTKWYLHDTLEDYQLNGIYMTH